jgi:hypothetical protein
MSLQTDVTTWRNNFDQTNINTNNPAYLGSIKDTSGVYHTGAASYQAGTNNPYPFTIYAGQGVNHTTPAAGGGKYVLTSTNGFSWTTTDSNGNGKYEFNTSGALNTLTLGTTPATDHGAAPASSTLTSFLSSAPLIQVTGFNVAVDYVAQHEFGVANGNSAIAVTGTFASLLSNAALFDSSSLNAAIIYDLTFDSTSTQAFEYVLDKYLESKGSDITDTYAHIQTALAGSGVSITYYAQASSASGVTTAAVAQAETSHELLHAA